MHANIRLAIWEKFAVVGATGGVMALTRLPIGAVLAVAETAALMHDTVAEAAAVGRAGGLALADDYADRVMDLLAGYPASTKSSRLTDLEAGRRLELEAITGTAVRLGRERGVPTPANTAIYAGSSHTPRGRPA